MSNIVNKLCSLSLNKNWMPVNIRSIKDAIVDLCSSESMGDNTCFALDIDYNLNEKGEPKFDETPKNIRPVAWSEWCKLPIREWEFAINTPKMTVRAPTVTVAVNYTKMPKKFFRNKPNKDGLWRRDKGICQYTGVKLDRKNASIDHIIPKSKCSDADTWTNMVVCSKDINFKKGNKLNEEIGLKLIRPPVRPRPLEAYETITEAKDVTWVPFLINAK
jgi:5-methylcytosine-specific restriction endonuclease McrA